MKLHRRTMFVQRGRNAIHQQLWELAVAHELTYVEMAQVVNEFQAQLLKAMLREERHPGQPDRKADEA